MTLTLLLAPVNSDSDSALEMSEPVAVFGSGEAVSGTSEPIVTLTPGMIHTALAHAASD